VRPECVKAIRLIFQTCIGAMLCIDLALENVITGDCIRAASAGAVPTTTQIRSVP